MVKSISQWRREITDRLRPIAGELAAFESYRILGHLCGCGPTELTLRSSDMLKPEDEERVGQLVEERLTGKPLAYVLGIAYFGGLELACDARAMIPRPETEEMLEIALERLPPPGDRRRRPVAIDVGTGSGNIALAMAHARPDLLVIATDIEHQALELAGENRRRHHMTDRIRFVCGRSLSMFAPRPWADLIVSNPPYIALGNPFLEPSVLDYEPHTALFAGPDGLEIISELFAEAETLLVPGGWFISEIGYDQAEGVRCLTTARSRWDEPILCRDMAGIDRIVAVRRRS